MNMDLYRSGDHFIAEIDLPGVDHSTIHININDRTLTIRAERKSTADDEAQWLTRERATGTFARQLALGPGIDAGRIEADYTDGVLTVTLPVAEESKPRKISVAHSGGQREIKSEVVEDGQEG